MDQNIIKEHMLQEDDQHQRLLIEAIKDDPLRRIEKEYKTRAEHTILTAAKLIAPVIEGSFAVGFDWCIERVKESPYSELASELEITKALTFLKQKDIPKVPNLIHSSLLTVHVHVYMVLL